MTTDAPTNVILDQPKVSAKDGLHNFIDAESLTKNLHRNALSAAKNLPIKNFTVEDQAICAKSLVELTERHLLPLYEQAANPLTIKGQIYDYAEGFEAGVRRATGFNNTLLEAIGYETDGPEPIKKIGICTGYILCKVLNLNLDLEHFKKSISSVPDINSALDDAISIVTNLNPSILQEYSYVKTRLTALKV